MGRPRTKQRKLLEKAFNDNYHRKVNAPFGVLANPRNFKHDGVDYGVNEGEPIYPIHDDVEVTRVVNNVNRNYKSTTYSEKDFGNYIIYYIPAWNVSVLYAHLQKVEVGVGKHGYKRFGRVGNTGLSTGPHLHLGFAKGKHTSLGSIRRNGIDFESWKVPTIQSKPQSKPEGKRYINIHKGRKYGTYSLNVVPVAKNIDQWLRPDNLGGMSYEIIGDTKYRNVFLIQTRDFGKRQIYLDTSRASLTSKPLYKVYGGETKPQTTKPKSNKIGKWANFKGSVRLFQKSRGDACYHATRNGQNNVYTNVRATSAKVLDEDNGRVLVSVPRFNPQKVWIANSESTISNSPKYEL